MPHNQSPASNSRREFVKLAAASATVLALPRTLRSQPGDHRPTRPAKPHFNLFSKHLQFLDYTEMAEVAAEIGFDGIDLTVRPDGHVTPERVGVDLPKAAAAIEARGLRLEMITTAVDDANEALDRDVLKAAADAGVKYYRMNWLRYPEGESPHQSLARYEGLVQELAALNRDLGLIGCYQNHAGIQVGASLWEVWQLLQSSDPKYFGIQYDPRHATVEGGLSWPTGLRLALPRIKTLVVKDFKWIEKDGRNQIVNTPVGEGTVDFPKCFRILKDADLHVPISLHLEYDLGGAEWGRRQLDGPKEAVYDAMRKDLAAAKRLWAAA